MLTTRLLPPEEWAEKLADRPPFAGNPLPDPEHFVIPVVERDGVIVASCALFDAAHWDCFHVNDAYQGNPGVFRALLKFSVQTMRDHGVPGAHVTVPAHRSDLIAMVEAFGFVKAPHLLYFYPVPQEG